MVGEYLFDVAVDGPVGILLDYAVDLNRSGVSGINESLDIHFNFKPLESYFKI